MADTRDLPLLRFGEELRRNGQHRRARVRRWLIASLLIALIVALLATSVWRPRPWLLWNVTESTPVGLYAVSAPSGVGRGDVVVAWAPDDARRLGAERHYLPINVPMVKEVAAQRGDLVCAIGESIFINGHAAALRRAADGLQRPMPWWNGCAMLGAGEVFLLSPDAPAAFDGRYFGVTSPEQIVGRARLIWRA